MIAIVEAESYVFSGLKTLCEQKIDGLTPI